MSYKKASYLKYRLGKKVPYVLVDAVHASSPNADLYTDEIADRVSTSTDCNCIIATVSRNKADLNRPPEKSGAPEAIFEYRNVLKEILTENKLLDANEELKVPFLHIAIHGMRDKYNLDVEVGTRNKKSCQLKVREWILKAFDEWSMSFDNKKPKIGADQFFVGDKSIQFHRNGDKKDYPGYGQNFNTLQIEFAHWLRSKHQDKIVNFLTDAIKQFNS